MPGEVTEVEELRQQVRDLESQLCQRNARARIRAIRHIRDAQMRELDRERRRIERLESDRMRMLWLQEFSLRQTSIVAAEKAIRRLRKGRDNARDQFRQFANGIREAADAYPVHIWPEPDLARVHEILQAHGLTLDVVAASIRREVFGMLVKRLDESCPEK